MDTVKVQRFLTYTIFSACLALCVAVDDTLREGTSGSAVVRAVIGRIEDTTIFPNDNQLLRRIAYVESRDGTDSGTYRNGYYGGIWQVDEMVFENTQDTTSHPALAAKLDAIQQIFAIDWRTLRWQDLRRPLYSGLAARLFLANIPAAIPFASNLQAQGEYWNTHYNTNAGAGAVQRFVQDVQSLLLLETCSVNSDIIFVLDASGSIGSSNFQTVRQFVLDFVQGLEIGPNDNQVGVIRFSSSNLVDVIFNLNTYSSKNDVLNAVSNIAYTGGSTNTHLALRLLLSQGFTTGGGARLSDGSVLRLAVVVTDGRSTSFTQTMSAARAVNSFVPSINVYTIGVTNNINRVELDAIASQPDFVFLLSSFNSTVLGNLQQQQSYQLCFRVSTQVQVGQSPEGELDRGENVRFMYTIPAIGTTIQMCIEIGNVVMFASTVTTTPNSALHEYSLDITASGTSTRACGEVYVIPPTGNNTLYSLVSGLQDRNRFTLNSATGDTRSAIVIGFVQTAYTVNENVGLNNFLICTEVVIGAPLSQSINLQITLFQGNGDAVLSQDFGQLSPNPFPIEFTPTNDNQQLCVRVNIMDDLFPEEDESFYASLQLISSISVTVNPSMVQITIIDDLPLSLGPGVGDDPHFAIYLPSGKLLCYTVQGEHEFSFNLISNENLQMNARFIPDAHREEVTWIGSLGIVVQNTHFQGMNVTKIRFESDKKEIHINNKMTLQAKNIESLTFKGGKLLISEGPMTEMFHYPSVRVNLDDLGLAFKVNFTGDHLDMMWNTIIGNSHSHGIIGQFFREGVEIDAARKLLLLPKKAPVPVMRKPVWAYMEHNVPNNQLCWVAMNPGYQGKHLIDGHYLDYIVDDVLSTDFKFSRKHVEKYGK